MTRTRSRPPLPGQLAFWTEDGNPTPEAAAPPPNLLPTWTPVPDPTAPGGWRLVADGPRVERAAPYYPAPGERLSTSADYCAARLDATWTDLETGRRAAAAAFSRWQDTGDPTWQDEYRAVLEELADTLQPDYDEILDVWTTYHQTGASSSPPLLLAA